MFIKCKVKDHAGNIYDAYYDDKCGTAIYNNDDDDNNLCYLVFNPCVNTTDFPDIISGEGEYCLSDVLGAVYYTNNCEWEEGCNYDIVSEYKRSRGFEFVDKEFVRGELPRSLPTRSTNKSAGYDFYSPVNMVIYPKQQAVFQLNVKAYMQDDEVLEIHIRSSLGFKHQIILSNCTGIIDSDYYNNKSTGGNIGIALTNLGEKAYHIKKGDKLCQGIFKKFLIVDDDCPISTERTGGIGSTGK